MTAAAVRASDAPARPPGTRARSGNAMGRTRAALLAAAASCVQDKGVRGTTTTGVARTAGVAKATLYNHFRTRDDVLVALVESEVERLAAQALAAPGLADALAVVASELATSGPLRRVAGEEPAVLGALLQPGDAAGWQRARAGAAALLARWEVVPDDARVGVVLRWCAAAALWPAAGDDVALGARLLAEGLLAEPGAVPGSVPGADGQTAPGDDAPPA